MPGKSVTLPPEIVGGEENEVRPSPVTSFLRKMGGRVLGRGRSPSKKNREETDEGREKSKSTSKSPARFVGQTLQRLSMRRREKISLCEDDASPSNVAFASPRGIPPRPAISENDLRNITIRRGSTDIPITPLAGATTYMSEDNLASAECGGVPYRTPSYVRISCTLNGYRSPSRLNHTPITTTPTRPKITNNEMPKSLVERRLDQLRNPTCPDTPGLSTSPDRTSYLDCPSTPAVSQSSAMGNASCTPTPIKNLISHFDKLQICTGEEEHKENVQPHSLVINEQPGGEEKEKGKEKDTSRLKFDDDEEDKGGVVENEKLEKGLEEEEVNHNVINVLSKSLVVQENGSEVRDGTFFLNLLASTRSSLSSTAKNAEDELERLQSDLSEPAAAVLRILIGKTLLLNGKKLKKFEELVQKNLHPRADDSQPATIDDLEGYWGLVEIELQDIAASSTEVNEWRSRGWTGGEEEKSPSQTSRDESDSGRGNSDASSRPSSRGKVAPAKSAVPRPAQSEKAKEAAEKRRKEMIEMKARMRKEKENKGVEEDKDGTGVLMVL